MKITISIQHLDGNDPDGFNADAWLDALKQEYTATTKLHFPDANVTITVDRQPRNSGYSRPIEILFDDENVDFDARRNLESSIDATANILFDQRGDEFFN